MATVTRENIGLLHDKLTVNITPADYKKTYDASLRKYSEKANIPGFRKGKVPTTVLAKMFGSKIIVDEVLGIAERSVSEYINNEKIDTFFQPLPVFSRFDHVDVTNLKDFSFDFEVGLRPKIEIKPEDIKVTRYIIDVTDDLINSQITRLQEQFGEQIEKDEVSSDEDLLNVIFDEIDAEGIVLEDGISKATSINVKYFTEEKRKALIGLKVDGFIDTSLVDAFPEDVINSILEDLGLEKSDDKAKEKHFKITITKISILEKATLGDDLYAKAYKEKEIKSEEELKEAVKEEIRFYFAQESRKQMHDQIYHHLIDNIQVEIPEEFVLKIIEISDEKRKTREEALAIYPDFSTHLKWTLLTSQVQQNENISVGNEDYINLSRAQIQQYFGGQQFNFGENETWLNDLVERNAKDKKFREQHYNKILTEKIFVALENKITPTEESIDVDTFATKVHHHHF